MHQKMLVLMKNIAISTQGHLEPVTGPVAVDIPDGWRPLMEVQSGIIVTDGSRLAYSTSRGIVKSVAISEDPKAVYRIGHDKIAVVFQTKNRIFSTDLLREYEAVPGYLPYITAVADVPVMVRFPALTLSRIYSRGETVRNADAELISQKLRSVYEYTDAVTARSGLFWQPVLVRLRAFDNEGRTVFYTDPQLFTHPTLPEFGGYITLQSSGESMGTAGTDISVPTYRLTLTAPEAAGLNPLVAGYDVMVTNALHNSDVLSDASVDTSRRTTDNWIISATMRGGVLLSAPVGARPDALRRIFAHLETIEKPSTTALTQTLKPGVVVSVTPPVSTGVADAQRRLVKALSTVPARLSPDLVGVLPPHSFTGACMGMGSAAAVWGDIVANRFAGWDIRQFMTPPTAGGTLKKQWQASVRVEFNDCSSSVRQFSGQDIGPLMLMPVVSYPSPDAVSITVKLRFDGSVYSYTMPLVPDSSGRRAVFVHSSLRPFAMQIRSAIVIDDPETADFKAMPTALVLASSNMPLLPRAVTTMSDLKINAVTQAVAGQSAWDFGRTRFYVFGSGGIHLLNADLQRGAMSLSYLDSHVVDSPNLTAFTSEGVMAVSHAELISIAGHKVRHVCPAKDVDSLVWVPDAHELWCMRRDAHATVVRNSPRLYTYTLSRSLKLAAGSGLVQDTATGQYFRPGHNASDTVADIECQFDVAAPKNARGMAMLCIDARGTFEPVTVSLHRVDGGEPVGSPDFAMTVSGAVTAPLYAAVPVYEPRQPLRVTVSGQVSIDSKIYNPQLLPCSQ